MRQASYVWISTKIKQHQTWKQWNQWLVPPLPTYAQMAILCTWFWHFLLQKNHIAICYHISRHLIIPLLLHTCGTASCSIVVATISNWTNVRGGRKQHLTEFWRYLALQSTNCLGMSFWESAEQAYCHSIFSGFCTLICKQILCHKL